MTTRLQEKDLYAFGAFRLDARERLLTCADKRVPLPPKVFETLLVLVQNAGSLVEKEALLRHLWPDTFVEEGNIPKYISMLRKALGEFANGTEYIETVPKRGYRFLAEVTTPLNGGACLPAVELPLERTQVSKPKHWLKRTLPVPGTLFIAASVIVLSLLLSPVPPPKVVGTMQLTRSGWPRWNEKVFTDKVRLYFVQRIGGKRVLAWVPVDGGDPTPIPTPFTETILLDLSPDHVKLLLTDFDDGKEEGPLWTMPVTGGSPEPLGPLKASDAAWFPDGRRILFARGSEVYVANQDGSEPRKVSTTTGRPSHFHWSPNGQILRFTVEDAQTTAVSIWEAAADGTNAHPWSPARPLPRVGFLSGDCCGVWTPNGKYFIYRSSEPGTVGLWALREKSGLRGRLNNKPFLLHTWPNAAAFFNPVVAPDGKHIFFLGDQDSRETVRYDAGFKRFVQYLPGVWARRVDFSGDGEWVTYYTQDYRLWRSRVDGSDRLQLTFPPLNVAQPRWSPDGTRIAFRGDDPDGRKIYLISRDGGTPEAISPAHLRRTDGVCWLHDGRSLVFGESPAPGLKQEEYGIYRIDLGTGQVAKLPGSEGLWPQDVSPDGKMIAAFTSDDTRLMLFNSASGLSSELAHGKSLYGAFWSRDGKYIYFQDLNAGVEQPIYRVRVSDRRVEHVAGLAQFARADAMAFSLAGLTPDGSPLASLILGRGDIYRLEINFPESDFWQ